jgi:hypothetical protein
MQGDGQLDHAKPGADVPPRARADVDQPVAHLLREPGQVFARQPAKVGRRANLIQKCHMGIKL